MTEQKAVQYFEMAGFEDIYLEDSYVLSIGVHIGESKRVVQFSMSLVLTENHPRYSPPKAKEQYCYRRAKITFSDIQKFQWIECDIQQTVDAQGEVDFGNIDAFYKDGDQYFLEGDWGKMRILSEEPSLIFERFEID